MSSPHEDGAGHFFARLAPAMPSTRTLLLPSGSVSRAFGPGFIGAFAAGDQHRVERKVQGMEPTNPLTVVTLTVKDSRGDPDPGIFQEIITATLTPLGQITDDGTTDGTADFFFFLTPANTQLLVPTFPAPFRPAYTRRFYDIQLQTQDLKIATVEMGTIVADIGVTLSNSLE